MKYIKNQIDLSELTPDKFYWFLLSCHIGIVWILPYFPTQDGPSHIYNLVILKDLLNGGTEWGSYYTYMLSAVPNLGFNLFAYSMLHFFSPIAVEKLFVSFYIVLLGGSVPLFLRTFNKKSLPFMYFVFPVIFNFNLLMGFYSFVIAVPLLLVAFSFSWKIQNSSNVCKFIFFNIAGFILFYCHLIPFILFLISLVAIAVMRSIAFEKKIIELAKLFVIISPIIMNLVYYQIHSTSSIFPDLSYLFNAFRYVRLFADLFSFSTFSTLTRSLWQIIPVSLVMFLYLFFSYKSVLRSYCFIKKDRKLPDAEKVLFLLVAMLILIYLFLPSKFGGGAFFNARFPWIVLLIMLPLFQMPETFLGKQVGKKILIGSVCFLFAFNTAVLYQQSQKVEKYLSGLDVDLPKGAYMMHYHKKSLGVRYPRVDVLLHAVSNYARIKGGVDIGNYEAAYDYFFIGFKNTVPQFPSLDQIQNQPETIDWSYYPSIQYVLGWEVDSKDVKKLAKTFHVVWQEDSFSLWKKTSSSTP